MKRYKYEVKILNKPNGDYIFDDINKLKQFISDNNIETDFTEDDIFGILTQDNYTGYILVNDIFNEYNLEDFNIDDLRNVNMATLDNYIIFEYNDRYTIRYFWCVIDDTILKHKLKEATPLNEHNKTRIKINNERYSMKKLFRVKGGNNGKQKKVKVK